MKLPTNKSFGITFGCVFFIIFIYTYINYGNSAAILTLLFLSIVFFILGFFNSRILHPLNFIWFKLGIYLGKVVSPILLGIIFFIVVTPTGILMRVLRKDLLSLKFNSKDSYWIKKSEYKSKMKNQF